MRPMPIVEAYSKVRGTNPELHVCDVYLCDGCGHVQLTNVVAPEKMFTTYQYRTGDTLREYYASYALYCMARFRPLFVVEIGSNDGTLLKHFEGYGCRTLGVDPSDVAITSGVPTIGEFFSEELAERIATQHGRPEVICANHVFAHADDLLGMMRAVKMLLAPGGVFIFEAAYLWDMLANGWFDLIYHEHLSYHAIRPLRRAFESVGMCLREVQHTPCKGGSIRGFVTHDGAALRTDEPDAEERHFGTLCKRLVDARERVRNLEYCYGYGAGPVVTLYQLGLQERALALVDDNRRKWGLYSPGGVPVRSPEVLYGYDNDGDSQTPVVILATRYAPQIMAQHPALKEAFICV